MLASLPTTFVYPEHADRYYAVVDGRSDVSIIAENDHAIAFDDGSDADTTRISVITRTPISSLAALDLGDALRWVGILDAVRALPAAMGWGPREGFRIDLPVHPPYQREPWLRLQVTRKASKTAKRATDAHGYTRDIGHFAEVVQLRRRVQVIYANDEFLVFHNPEEPDNAQYDVALMGIPRRHVRTILDDDFQPQDWLSLVAGVRQAAARLGLTSYTTYMNVRPPYQHTPWVHVHLLAGGKALRKATAPRDGVANPDDAR